MKSKTPILIVILATAFWAQLAYAQKAEDIGKVSFTVSDLDKAVEFYTSVLPFEKSGRYTIEGQTAENLFGLKDKSLRVEIALLRLGSETIELMEFDGRSEGRVIPFDSRSNDLWFQHIAIVVSDMEHAYEQVASQKVTHVSTAPQTLPAYIPAAHGIKAFYFRDPDGHNLELIYFPHGKGNPRWKEQGDNLFLGIDHTAIGIEETDSSLQFYRDFLGLEVAGQSENYGSEQEHLNQVFGARLQITGLHAKRGFGLEFLDYIAPPGGRQYPLDSKPNDLWHWHTTVKVDQVEELYKQAISSRYAVISEGLVDMGSTDMGAGKAFLMRGPDGHVILITN